MTESSATAAAFATRGPYMAGRPLVPSRSGTSGRKGLCTLVVLVWAYGVGCLHAQDNVDFKREAVGQWHKYLDLLGRGNGMTVTADLNVRETGGDKRVQAAYHFRLVYRPGAALTESPAHGDRGAPEEVVCQNPAYAFQLRRKSAGKPWVLTEFAAGADTGNLIVRFPAKSAIETFFHRGLTLNTPGERLVDLIDDADFVVTGTTLEQRAGKSLVRVTFRNTPKLVSQVVGETTVKPARQVTVVSGSMLLDPQQYWLLQSYSAAVQWSSPGELPVRTSDCTGEYTYQQLKNGLPVLSRVALTFVNNKPVENRPDFSQVLDYKFDETTPTEADFTLAKYGLPEPAGNRRSTPWYLWVCGAALVFAGLAALFRRLSRRSLAGPSTGTSGVHR
ncbi:MAG: hypothetical protein U0746_03795 [Gemmataceae bacterium]